MSNVRVVGAILISLALGNHLFAAAESKSSPWWQNEPLRIIQTNLREIDADLDPVAVARQAKAMGANAIIFNCAGIRAFYQTRLKYHRKAVALNGDLAVEMRKAAREAGLRFIARLDLSKADKSFYEMNPDWFQCDYQGIPHEYNGLHICCPNGAYYREYSHKIIAEVIERIQPDAMFFNMFGFTSRDYSGRRIPLCHCAGCQKRYLEFTGKPLPRNMSPSHPDYGLYLEFRRHSIETLTEELRSLIHDLSGGRCAFFTYVDDADMRRMEANSGVGRRPRTNYFSAVQAVGRFKVMYPEKPCCCAAVHFLGIPYRYSSEPAGLTGMRLVQSLAAGGELDFYVLGTLDQPDRRDFGVVKKWFHYYEANSGAYFHSRSIARMAIVRRSGDEFQGAYKLFVERGVPVDVIDCREDWDRKGLYSRYDLIWCPGLYSEDSEQGRVLERFVRRGGILINTADRNVQVPSFFGVRREEAVPARRATYFRLTPRDAFPRAPRAELIMAKDIVLDCKPQNGTQAFLSLISQHSDGPPELAYFTDANITTTPGLFIHSLGRGKVVFFPWPIDRLYEEYFNPAHRELVFDVLDMLHLSPQPARVLGGRPVLVTARRSADNSRILINLINLTGYGMGQMADPEPLDNVKVKVSLGKPPDALEGKLLVSGGSITAADGVFTVPRLDLFETISIPNPNPAPAGSNR